MVGLGRPVEQCAFERATERDDDAVDVLAADRIARAIFGRGGQFARYLQRGSPEYATGSAHANADASSSQDLRKIAIAAAYLAGEVSGDLRRTNAEGSKRAKWRSHSFLYSNRRNDVASVQRR